MATVATLNVDQHGAQLPKKIQDQGQQRLVKQEGKVLQPQQRQSALTGSPSVASSQEQTSSAPKRRPPPILLTKTTSTKKDRATLVANCVEPRQGQTRYWTGEEHDRFLEAIKEYGEKAYVAISNYVETRTPKQVRTHAQKFQMKMARLARQSLEAGQPISMPPGMCPVIEVPVGAKSTIVLITPEQSEKLAARPGGAAINATIVSTLSTTRQSGKKRSGCGKVSSGGGSMLQDQSSPGSKAAKKLKSSGTNSKGRDGNKTQRSSGEGAVMTNSDADADSNGGNGTTRKGGEASRSRAADGCVDYIQCDTETKDEMELETSLAERLNESLAGNGHSKAGGPGKSEDFLVSERSTNESTCSGPDDDLEDLDKLEDGDFSLAPFAAESWLLPDEGSGAEE